MLNLSRKSHNFIDLADSDLKEIAQKSSLPRHISILESPIHSRKARQSLFQTVRTCPLEQQDKSAEATNLAVNILQYQLRDSVAQDRHLNNLRSNLQHRLEVAQAENNQPLVIMLRKEFKQLEASI